MKGLTVTTFDRQFRKRLLAEKTQVEMELGVLEQELENKGDYSLGEGDPAIYEWEMNLARRRELRSKLIELDEALQRLDAGKYTVCAVCGLEIEEGRLELLPATKVCSRCARGGRGARRPRSTG